MIEMTTSKFFQMTEIMDKQVDKMMIEQNTIDDVNARIKAMFDITDFICERFPELFIEYVKFGETLDLK